MWRTITRQVADDGRQLDNREQEWLTLACAEADQLAGIEAALVGAPMTVKGAQGQLVAHPLLSEARRSRQSIAQWLRLLDVSDPDAVGVAGPGSGSRTTTATARRAALARWHGAS